MTDWILGRVIVFLALAAFLTSTYCKSLADDHHKPGRSWTERRYGMPWPEFYTPKGRSYLMLSLWLHVVGFVLGLIWMFAI